MAWAVPLYERKDVNLAGEALAKIAFPVTTLEGTGALTIINNWRSSHAYALNIFQMTLRKRARRLEREALVAQRIKRLESIHFKLTRHQSMRMTQMQDIAGCRAVMASISSVRALVKLYQAKNFEHKLKGEKNYIDEPKADGYRCHHLVFSYQGTDERTVYTGLSVETQIRTQLQHIWATAVEAVGTFTRQALKSNQGSPDWQRFFALMGSAIAAIEKCQSVPNTPASKSEMVAELQELVERLRVFDVLAAYVATIEYTGSAKDAKYFLISLSIDTGKLQVLRFKARQSEAANAKYTELEGALAEGSSTQIALVSADNIAALRRAYPNYFLDTKVFRELVTKVLQGQFPKPQSLQTIADAA